MKHVEKLTPEKVKETVHKVLLFKPFKLTFTYQVVEHISQASKIGILVMTVDVSIYFVWRRPLIFSYNISCAQSLTTATISSSLSLVYPGAHSHWENDG
eukprot:scaffold4576_cov128-Skeletonema_menzelii.AAC.7